MIQLINGTALVGFLFLVGFTFVSNIITLGMIVVLFTYFRKLQESLADISDMHTDLIDSRSAS